MASPDIDPWMVEAFKEAIGDFKSRVKASNQINLDNYQSINDVYEETVIIQAEQAKTGTLRASSRLTPYLKFLAQYESVIDVFVQVKPEILALIWGPIKLILHFASRVTKAFDKIVEVLGNVGQTLPDLHTWAAIFSTNPRVKRVLCLFYQDILDLHLILLNFFLRKKWDLFFEAFWPKTTDLVTQIRDNMSKHKGLMTEEVTLEHIIQAHSARQHANAEIERNRELQETRLFHGLLSDLKIELYDADLETLVRSCPPNSGEWILDNEDYKKWSNSSGSTNSRFWLQGIPGAGKTVLSGKVTQHLRRSGQTVLFIFLTYRDPDQSRALKVFQSLIFQLLFKQTSLQAVIREAHVKNHRELTGSDEFVQKLFLDLVRDQGTIYIVIDGLDEAVENDRLFLLKSLLGITAVCQDLKLFISCRNDHLLDRELNKCTQKIRVNQHNAGDISVYLASEETLLIEQWRELGADEVILAESKATKDFIMAHSQGMILYAKLMMGMLKSLDSPLQIRDELQNLPEGLDQAYARILERIKTSPDRTRVAAERILQWLGCASNSQHLRPEEILQALIIEKGSEGFKIGRKALRDLRQTCGPIIEIEDGYVRFVHFSAKEYIFKGRGSFLTFVDSNQEIASTILTYLSFNTFDSVFSDPLDEDETKKRIMSKDFVLFQYAATHWLTHVRGSFSTTHQTLPKDFIEFLSVFANMRGKQGKPSQDSVIVHSRYQALEMFPFLQSMVSQAESYTQHCHASILEQENEANDDPTLVSMAHMRFRHCLESLLCKSASHDLGCSCRDLEASYGRNLFKCNRISCPHYSKGFTTSFERDRHLNTHSRPYKCTELNCLFAELGLQTPRDLQRHFDCHHGIMLNNPEPASIPSDSTNISRDDLIQIIKDAIQDNDLELVRDLLPRCEKFELLAKNFFSHAAGYGSEEMLQLILEMPGHDKINFWDAAESAILEDNLPALHLCIKCGADPILRSRGRTLLGIATRWGSTQSIEIFLQIGVTEKMIDYRRPSSFSDRKSIQLFLAEGDRLEEYMAMFRRYKLPGNLLQWLLASAIDMNSIHFAKFCLQQSAKVNESCKSGDERQFMHARPLYAAVRKGLANMAILLLQNGADDDEAIRNLPGVKKIEASEGINWSEIVQRYRYGSAASESNKAEI